MWKSVLVATGTVLILLSSAAAQQSDGSMAPWFWFAWMPDQVDTTYDAIVWNRGDAVLEGAVTTVRLTWTDREWLQASPASLTIPPGSSDTITISILRSLLPPETPGILLGTLEGAVRVVIEPPTVTDTLGTFLRVELYAQPITPDIDTVQTCDFSLVVNSNGNLGNAGSGGANMSFAADCDTGWGIPGDESIYLFDASPVVFTSPTSGNWSLYLQEEAFIPTDDICSGLFALGDGEGYHSGKFYTRDSLLEGSMNLYASYAPDSCNFLVQRLQLQSPTGSPVNDLVLGFFADWDIPSDSLIWNAPGFDPISQVYWQRGVEFDEPVGDSLECQQNSARFGGMGLIALEIGAGGPQPFTEPAGVHIMPYNTLSTPQGRLDSAVLYDRLTAGTNSFVTDSTKDLVTIMSFLDNFDLPGTETLTVWLALGAVENGTESDMSMAISDARSWFWENYPLPTIPAGCGPACIRTGDVNQDWQTNLTDLTILVNCLFVTFECQYISYKPAANTSGDQNCDINLTDLTALVNSLFVTFEELPLCTSFDYTLCF